MNRNTKANRRKIMARRQTNAVRRAAIREAGVYKILHMIARVIPPLDTTDAALWEIQQMYGV